MKLIIAGGRNYELSPDDLIKLHDMAHLVTEVVSGGASGVDQCGEAWAEFHGLPVKRFPAQWFKHGRAAGPIRNREMAEYADAVVLFPGGRGTANMHTEAVNAGLKIYDWR